MANHLFCGNGPTRSGLIISTSKVGSIVGTIMAGIVPTRFGRRRPVQLAICLHAVFYGALAFTKHMVDYAIVFTLCEMCSCFIWTTFSAYGVEVIGPRYRVYFGSLVGCAHSFGFVLVAMCAMYMPDRQLLTIVLASLFSLNIAYVAFIPESPVWALSTARYNEARMSIATLSGRVRNQDGVEALIRRMSVTHGPVLKFTPHLTAQKEDTFIDKLKRTSMGRLMRASLIRKFTLLSVIMYACSMMAYFGTAYYAAYLPGNIYFNNFATGGQDGVKWVSCDNNATLERTIFVVMQSMCFLGNRCPIPTVDVFTCPAILLQVI